MSTQTVSAADAILKDDYVGPVIEQINQKTYVLDRVERDTTSVDHTGRRAIVPVHISRNVGRGSRADAGTLPTAGVQGWLDAIVPIRYHYIGIEISDGAMEAATGANNGAFLNILTAETKGAAQDAKKDINRQIFGTGDGLLASVAATATTTPGPITLDSVQYVAVGDPVDVVVKSSGAAGTGASGTTIAARVGGTTKTVTFGTTVTVDLTYGVYLAGNRNNEMDGLQNIASTARTLHSINSSTYPIWDGQVRDVGTSSTAAVAGETSFEQLADDVGATGNGEITTFLTTRGIRRRLADTYQSQKRFNDAQAVRVHGGYSAIMVNEIPVISDDDCPRGFAFGFDDDALRWFTQVEFAWMEKANGGVFHLKDGSSAGQKVATWQAWGKRYSALGSVRPNSVGKLRYASDDNPS